MRGFYKFKIGFLIGLLSTVAVAQTVVTKPSVPEIVQEHLIASNGFYTVKGSIYNPTEAPMRGVEIRYYVWGKWKGKDGHGSVIRDTGGQLSATIKYLPPKQTVEFVATGLAPTMTPESGLQPDPIKAEITVSAHDSQ